MKKSKKIQKINFKNKKVLTVFLILVVIIFVLLLVRIAVLQFVQGNELKSKASIQQTTTRTLSANRGTIYDCNGRVLASSANVDTVSVNPQNIFYSNKNTISKKINFLYNVNISLYMTLCNNILFLIVISYK